MSEAKPKKRLDAVVRSRVQPVLELLHKANTSSQDLSVESRQLLAELSRTKRRVSRFWIEKAVVILDALQIYGLMWQLAQIWPWPSKWLAATRWTVLSNLDILSLTATGAGMGQANPPFSHWGDLRHYWAYALGFALVPYMLGIGWWCAFRHWRSSGDVSFLSKRAVLENKLLFVLQWMYLPIGLAVSRLWHCQDAPNPLDRTEMLSSMSVDATVACLGTTHTMALIGIAGGLGLPFLVGFPILLYHRINFIGAFAEPERHERFIQAKELTYLLNVSDDYYVLNVAQYASYSRDMRLFPVHVCVLKVVLLGVFTFGRSRYPSIDMQPLQGMLFAVVLIVVVTHRSWWASPFRCRSTAQLSFVLDSLLTFDAIMVLLSANPIKSALTVASVKVALLGFVHTMGTLVVAGVVVGTFCKKRTRQLNWPTHIHMRPLVRHVAQVTKWVAALKAADHVLQRSFTAPAQVQPTDEFARVVADLQQCAADAAQLDHLLHDHLHEMAALISAAYVEALGSAVLASERIDDCVNKFISELQHYKYKHDMLPPPKRNALYKLHALKTWQSPDVCRVAVLQQQHKSPPGVDDFLPEPNKFQHLDVLVSTDPQLNFPSHVPSFSSLLQHTRRPPTSNDDHALIAVHWSAVILSNTNVNNSSTHEAEPPNVQEQEDATVLATVVQYESPWLLVKLPLLNDVEDANWTVLQGWIHVASPCVSLLVCHDPDTQNLFDELKGLQIMVLRPAIPMDASVISALIDASRTATTTTAPLATAATSKALLRQQWRRCIDQWNVQFVLRHGRAPTDLDKAKIRLWYTLFHALNCPSQPI